MDKTTAYPNSLPISTQYTGSVKDDLGLRGMLAADCIFSWIVYFVEAGEFSAMSAKYIITGLAASFAIAYASDVLVAQKKIFGGTTPRTVADKEWWQATDKKFQAWPRTVGPPVVMNPISRQNFIVKDLKP
ncbi:unnamed protein product [Miscanthus lutarioriparius]|uniref:Uncharacterized protein n=1 Tax=Miscanthus lutarioriparius TaxID=422564 RepID=A0A811S8X9_9POAL|nr:unnamed protein product [Miscanthus lutarioriparius]